MIMNVNIKRDAWVAGGGVSAGNGRAGGRVEYRPFRGAAMVKEGGLAAQRAASPSECG